MNIEEFLGKMDYMLIREKALLKNKLKFEKDREENAKMGWLNDVIKDSVEEQIKIKAKIQMIEKIEKNYNFLINICLK